MENKIRELEVKIALEKEKCEKYINEAEKVKDDCINLIINDIKNRIKRGIEEYVKKDVDNTNELGLEKLSILKKKMNEHILNVDNLKEVISNKNIEIWKVSQDFIETIDFNTGDNFGKQYNNKKEINPNVEDIIKNEYSKIGNLLHEFNYLNQKENSGREWEIKRGDYVYKYGISLSDKLRDSLKEYEKIFSEYFKSNENIVKYVQEFKETNALLLWSKA